MEVILKFKKPSQSCVLSTYLFFMGKWVSYIPKNNIYNKASKHALWILTPQHLLNLAFQVGKPTIWKQTLTSWEYWKQCLNIPRGWNCKTNFPNYQLQQCIGNNRSDDYKEADISYLAQSPWQFEKVASFAFPKNQELLVRWRSWILSFSLLTLLFSDYLDD